MPWAAFVWLAQMKNVESGVCQLLCSAEKSPLLLFLCVAKVCTLDKSPVSDRGTRCCSGERERTERVCSCSPPSPPPSQGASWLFGITCCTSRQRPPTPPLWAVKRHRTPRMGCPRPAAPLPSSLPFRRRWRPMEGTGTRDTGSAWSSHPAQAAAVLARTDKYPRGRAERPESALGGSGYGAARGTDAPGAAAGLARHGADGQSRLARGRRQPPAPGLA